MKNIWIILLGTALIATSCGDSSDDIMPSENDLITIEIDTFPDEPLSEFEKDALLFMREEEKLACDVYDFLYIQWSAQSFDNISSSEQSHMDAILTLIDKYGLDDPAVDNISGSFINEDLQVLYDDLTETGSLSKEDAFKVGAAIEEIDIVDLQRELDTTIDNEDVKFVFENLMKGSRNHLRAFVKNLKNLGVVYTPQYLTQQLFDEIINSDTE
ncbi:MAG: DUF2202 domain-containing protein [Cyclobacteriaceae bacterium]